MQQAFTLQVCMHRSSVEAALLTAAAAAARAVLVVMHPCKRVHDNHRINVYKLKQGTHT